MDFDLKSLELFVRVAALGALGRAGEEMRMSPTTATQRIQGLEAELGTTLLSRTTRVVSLTPEGERFLVQAQRILDCIESARAALCTSRSRIFGELRVTASASFGRSQIVPYVGEFLRAYPEITLKLELTDSLIDIVERGFDLAIRIGTLTPSSLIAKKLAPNPRVLVASPAYLERAGVPASPLDLKNHSCVVLGETRQWRLEDNDGQEAEVKVTGAFATNFGDAVTEALLQDIGIGLKSIWDVSAYLRSGRLVQVLPAYTVVPKWQIWAVRPPNLSNPPRVQAFISFFEERFRLLRGCTDIQQDSSVEIPTQGA